MSASPADGPAFAPDVLVAQTVRDRLAVLAETNPGQAEAVVRAIQEVGHAKARPIKIPVSGGPTGAAYMALAPSDPDAPVLIYRALIPGTDHYAPGWLVTTLLSRAEYNAYRHAESTGLLDDPVVRSLLVVGIGALIAWLMSRPAKPPTGLSAVINTRLPNT